MISAHYGFSDVFDNLIISLCKFTTLSSEVNPELAHTDVFSPLQSFSEALTYWVFVFAFSLQRTCPPCLAVTGRLKSLPRLCSAWPIVTVTSYERDGRTSWILCCSFSGLSSYPSPWLRWVGTPVILACIEESKCVFGRRHFLVNGKFYMIKLSCSDHAILPPTVKWRFCIGVMSHLKVEDFVDPNEKISLQREETPSNRWLDRVTKTNVYNQIRCAWAVFVDIEQHLSCNYLLYFVKFVNFIDGIVDVIPSIDTFQFCSFLNTYPITWMFLSISNVEYKSKYTYCRSLYRKYKAAQIIWEFSFEMHTIHLLLTLDERTVWKVISFIALFVCVSLRGESAVLSFVSWLTLSEQSGPRGPSTENQEAKQAALLCIKVRLTHLIHGSFWNNMNKRPFSHFFFHLQQCDPEKLITESKFLQLESLQELMKVSSVFDKERVYTVNKPLYFWGLLRFLSIYCSTVVILIEYKA